MAEGVGIDSNRRYVTPHVCFFTRGETVASAFVATLGKVALLSGLTFAAHRAITYARGYEKVQEAFTSVYLTREWDWLTSAAVAGVPTFFLIDAAVRRDVAQVHQELHNDIQDRNQHFQAQMRQLGETQGESHNQGIEMAKLEAKLEAIMKENGRLADENKEWRTHMLSQSNTLTRSFSPLDKGPANSRGSSTLLGE